MSLLDVLFYLQLLICILAIFFNALLIYLVTQFTENQLGFYKWIVVSYAVFETVYAFVILLGMPVHIVAYGSWMAYNYGGILAGTKFSYFGPALYCSFYEMWLMFLALHFVYRYVVVSLPNVSMKIETSPRIKAAICLVVVSFIGMTLFCSFYMCTRQKLTDDIKERVESEFGVDHMHPSEYILLQAKNLNGNISIFGLITIVNHHFLVIASFMVMFFCSYNINLTIAKLRTMGTSKRRIKLQRQLFFSLLLQTLVPVIFCHIPSIIFLSFPFLETTFSFGSFSLLFTFLTSLEKVIDPIIVIFCISDCRRAVKNRFSKVPLISRASPEAPTQRFYDRILHDYNRDVPAWEISNDSVILTFAVPFVVLGAMDENQQLVSFIAKVQLSWVDPRLRFDPDEIGTSLLIIPSSRLWVPTFEVYNSMLVESGDKPQDYDQVRIDPNGTATLMWKARFDTICELDMDNFPLDHQYCPLSFSCGLSPVEQLQARSIKSGRDFLVGSLEWNLLSPIISDYYFADDVRNQSLTKLGFQLTRNPQFYIYFLLLPTFMITTTCLSALLFPMKIDIGERINLGLAGLLGLTFMLSVIVVELPRTSSLPLMGKWLIIQMVFCMCGMLAHIPGLYIKQRYPKNPDKVKLFNTVLLGVVLMAHCLTSILLFVFPPQQKDPSSYQRL